MQRLLVGCVPVSGFGHFPRRFFGFTVDATDTVRDLLAAEERRHRERELAVDSRSAVFACAASADHRARIAAAEAFDVAAAALPRPPNFCFMSLSLDYETMIDAPEVVWFNMCKANGVTPSSVRPQQLHLVGGATRYQRPGGGYIQLLLGCISDLQSDVFTFDAIPEEDDLQDASRPPPAMCFALLDNKLALRYEHVLSGHLQVLGDRLQSAPVVGGIFSPFQKASGNNQGDTNEGNGNSLLKEMGDSLFFINDRVYTGSAAGMILRSKMIKGHHVDIAPSISMEKVKVTSVNCVDDVFSIMTLNNRKATDVIKDLYCSRELEGKTSKIFLGIPHNDIYVPYSFVGYPENGSLKVSASKGVKINPGDDIELLVDDVELDSEAAASLLIGMQKKLSILHVTKDITVAREARRNIVTSSAAAFHFSHGSMNLLARPDVNVTLGSSSTIFAPSVLQRCVGKYCPTSGFFSPGQVFTLGGVTEERIICTVPHDMVTVEFNTCSVVYGGWTPDELYQFAPQTDALLPAQPPLSIDPAVVERPRPSMVFAPFEALRCFWDPHRSASPSGADVLLAGAACCLQVSWKGEGGRQALPEGVTGEHSFWIRFVSTFPHRKYVVVRPPKQLATLLSALRVSFSHLLVPACSEPTIHAARGLLDFVEAHAEAVSAYLPLLYFLYEMNERSVQNFFDSVEELVRRRRLNESNLLNALRPRESSWFGLGTPRFVPQESSFSDDLTFMDAYAARLPNSFKVRFISANSRVEALERARSAAIVLRDALLEEIEAFEGNVEYLGKSTGKLFYHELAGYASDVLKREGEKGEQEEQDNFKNVYGTKRVKETIVECMYIASVLQGQIFAPMLKILVDSLRRAEHNAETEFEYFHSMLEFAKTVVRNEPFMTGSKGMHKSCPAAQNPVLLRQVSEHYGKVRQTFRAFKLHVEEEMILSENAIRQSLVLCCTHCFHAFTTFYDPFDARHYTRTVSPEGRDVSIHPLLQLFDSVKKEHTHAPTDR